MLPNQFDADVEMRYKAQRAHRDAERFRLAQQAAGHHTAGRWQARLGALGAAGADRLAHWLAAIRGGQDQGEQVVRFGAARGSRSNLLRRLEMWNVDRHIARAMVDDHADLEVEQRGLPVPTANPLQAVNSSEFARSQSRFGRWLLALSYRWKLFCRWLTRLGQPSGCDQAPAR